VPTHRFVLGSCGENSRIKNKKRQRGTFSLDPFLQQRRNGINSDIEQAASATSYVCYETSSCASSSAGEKVASKAKSEFAVTRFLRIGYSPDWHFSLKSVLISVLLLLNPLRLDLR
jgi:hypothetical protein